MEMVSNSAHGERREYSLPFWCFVFFTFIVFVAPQNIYPSLQPLHLAKVSIILALGFYVIQKRTSQESLFPSGLESRLLAIFIFLVSLSIPFSLWPGGSIATLTDFFAKSLVVFLLSAQLLTSMIRFKRMMVYIVLFCLIISIIAILGYQNGTLIEGYRMQGAWGGINSNPNDFALTINLIIPFGLAFYAVNRRIFQKLLCVAFIFLSIGAILLSFSRGGLFTLATILVLYIWKTVRQGKILKYALPLLLMLLAFIVMLPDSYSERLQSIMDSSKDKTGSSQARWDSAVQTLKIIEENPIFGVGVGMNVLSLNEKGFYWSRVHNVYLQIASEIGIPGMIVFVLLVIRLVRSARQIQCQFWNESERQELVAFANASEISLMAFSVAALFHPVAYHFYFYYISGFAVALKGISDGMRDVDDSARTRTVQAGLIWWKEQEENLNSA